MTTIKSYSNKPRLLFEVEVRQRSYRGRMRLALITILACIGALYTISIVRQDSLVDSLVLDIGQIAASFIIGFAGIRALLYLLRERQRRDERIRFFDQGMSWETKGNRKNYRWEQLRTFHEGGQGLYIGKRPICQWGSITFVMADDRVYKLYPWHGNLRLFTKILRPPIADVTGTRMAQMLRQEKPVQLHPRLTVWPGGLEVNKKEYAWQKLNVNVKRGRLLIRAKQKGKVRIVGRFSSYKVDNLGGFIELATVTIRNHRSRSTTPDFV